MSLEITGKLIVKENTIVVSDKFKKREFVIELAEDINGNTYTNFAKMQLVQNKCEIIDKFNVGDVIKVSFNIKGTKWQKPGEDKVSYFTNLDAWRIESPNAAPNSGTNQQQTPANNNNNNNYSNQETYSSNAPFNPSPEAVDDLPF